MFDSFDVSAQLSPLTRPPHKTARSNEGSGAALGSLRRSPNLDPAQERLLLEQVQSAVSNRRRDDALSELWLSHVKLVASIASRYRRAGVEIGDLISAGMLGLHDAIIDFDLERIGVRLATYAIPRIRHCMQEFIRQNAHPVALPATASHRQLYRGSKALFEDARRACLREGIPWPTSNDLCRRVGVRIGLSELEVEQALQVISYNHISLDEPPWSGKADKAASIGGHHHISFDWCDDLDMAEAKRRIRDLAATILGASERRVFSARFPGNADPARLDDLATELGVTRERVYQLEASAKRKIATALVAHGFAPATAVEAVQAIRFRAERRRDGPAEAVAATEQGAIC